MIHCNLSILLAERNLKISQVAAETKISRTTLTALAYNNSLGIQMATLNTLCLYLDIKPSDLFTFHPYDLILEEIHGTPEHFEAQYHVRNRLGSVICTLTGSASTILQDGSWAAATLVFEFANEDLNINRFFSEAFASLTPALKNDLEVDLFKKFVGDVLDRDAKPGTNYKMRFNVQWPSVSL